MGKDDYQHNLWELLGLCTLGFIECMSAELNYVGSIAIAPEWLDQVGILPLEEVDIINLNNGNRFSTYPIPGEPGTREIYPNGGVALLCQPGDLLIIYAYKQSDSYRHPAKWSYSQSFGG